MIVAVVFTGVLVLSKDIILGLVMLLLVIYVAGNGIIHSKTNELQRDSILEYILVSVIILVVIASALF